MIGKIWTRIIFIKIKNNVCYTAYNSNHYRDYISNKNYKKKLSVLGDKKNWQYYLRFHKPTLTEFQLYKRKTEIAAVRETRYISEYNTFSCDSKTLVLRK